MVNIRLNGVGKRFEGQWIFRDIDLELKNNEHLAVTGYNGSGKSTFLQLIAAFQTQTTGNIDFTVAGKQILAGDWYKYISCGAPYLDLPDDLTFRENIEFFASFKPIQKNLSVDAIAEITQLESSVDKRVRHFSSGMKQRLRLALAVLADVPVLLLDEPLSNLDQKGVDWYTNLIKDFAMQKLVVVCSNNQAEEIFFCERSININDFSR
jgi:ABC-type multidrug transport system ATPase subunit